MAEAPDAVIVIDDDSEVRDALKRLLRSVGLAVSLYANVSEFLKAGRPNGPTCLVLDVRLPGKSGLDFQRELSDAGLRLPIVFITGHGDIPMSVGAIKGGAIEFLTKPFRDQDLIDAVQVALDRDRSRRQAEGTISNLRAKFEKLTPREQDVMALVVTGLMNKQVAAKIG
ncbi:MAG TPA: response regulator, partial [Vicinamibacterales bacterium]|nr:response regulator [Vicinamibacterales bacterium]